MSDVKEALSDIKNAISLTQMSRSYKACLLYRRMIAQVFQGRWGDKKDFFKWMAAKAFRTQHNARALCEFDALEYAKKTCDQLETQIPVHASSIIRKNTQQIWIFDEYSYSGNLGKSILAEMAKAWNDMGCDVYYAFLEKELYPICDEPVSRRFSLKNVKMRYVVSSVRKGAVFIFLDSRKDFQRYIEFVKQHGLQMFLLEDLVRENEYLTDCALFEPRLKYAKPIDMNSKGTHHNIILAENTEEENFDLEFLNEIAKRLDHGFEFYISGHMPGSELQLCANIYFIGDKYIKDMPGYYAYADFLFFPVKNKICDLQTYQTICRQIVMGRKVIVYAKQKLELPNVVCCESVEEVCRAFKDKSVDKKAAVQFSIDHSYYRLCGQLLKHSDCGMEYPDISVIILNRNNKEVIFRCVDTLLRFNTYGYEIIVVDNDSDDGSYEMLKKKYEKHAKVKILKNHKNGCSSGRNLGAAHAKGEYIFFLDSDQWIIGDYWMDIALKIMREQIGIGAVAWNAGWFYPGELSALIVDYLPDRGIRPDMLYRTDIGLLATSGFLMRKDIFQEVGGFDEFYDPTCFEDTDLTLKIRNYGYETAYTPYMLIKHLPHQTTKSGSTWHRKLMERNERYCKEKWEKIDAALLEYYY